MINCMADLESALSKKEIEINSGGHNIIASARYTAGHFHTAFYMKEKGRDRTSDSGEMESDFIHCHTCGEPIVMMLSKDGKSIRVRGIGDRKLEHCKYEDAAKREFYIELDCPSGEFIIANDLRHNLTQDGECREVFEEPNKDRSGPDLNTFAGQMQFTQGYAAQGLGLIEVGNTSPSVIQNSPTKLMIGSFSEDAEDDDGKSPNEIGSICTDLWWYSIIDRSLFEEKFKMTPDEYDTAYHATGAWLDLIRAKVTPGHYRISSRHHIVDEDSEDQIFSVVEKIQ